MPRTYNVGDIVRLDQRVTTRDPTTGAQGRVAVIRAEGRDDRTIGVDFSGYQNYQATGTYENLGGTLPGNFGVWLAPQRLSIIAPVRGGLVLCERRRSMLDYLVGQTVRVTRAENGCPARVSGTIVAVTRDERGNIRIGVHVPGIGGGSDLGGYLPAGDVYGYWFSMANDSLEIRVNTDKLIIGMDVLANRDYGPVRAGMSGRIIHVVGDTQLGRNCYNIAWEGLEGGHNLDGRLATMNGWTCPAETVMSRQGYVSVSALARDMMQTRAINGHVLYFNANTELPRALEYDLNLQRTRHDAARHQWQYGEYARLLRGHGGDAVAGRIGRVWGRDNAAGAVPPGIMTLAFPDPFEGHDGNAGDGATNRWDFADWNSLEPVDAAHLPVGARVMRGPIIAFDHEEGYDGYPEGSMGTIRRIVGESHSDGCYAVEMYDQNDYGHTCGGHVDSERGYYLPPRALIPWSIPVEGGEALRRGERPAPPPRLGRYGAAPVLGLDPFAAVYNPGGSSMPDVIGHIATVTDRTSEMRANLIPIGAQGEIVGADGRNYIIDFHPMELPHGQAGYGPQSRWPCPRGTIRVEDTKVTRETVKLSKGDRVTVFFNGGGSLPPKDTEGVVLRVVGDAVEVDFYPYRWRHGRELSGGNPRSCAAVPSSYLRKMEIKEAEALKPYFLVKFEDGKMTPLEDQPTFESGQDASAHAKELMKTVPYKVQVRKLSPPDENWRAREEARFKDGSYKAMPKGWDLEPIKDHFLHLSVTQPGQVAFTPNEEYGQQDRQIHTRPGAYVQKFYPKLDPKQVARYSALAACEGGLEIVNDGDEMVRIYRLGEQGLGPDSCMKYDFVGHGHGGPRTPVHPISTYAAGDIALAYLRQDGAIVARCLIWPEKKLFTRAYGDLAKIIAVLEAEGYKRGNFIGARLKRVTFDYRDQMMWVCPYVDESNSVQGNPGALGVYDDGTHLIIREADQGQSTNQAMGCIVIDSRFRRIDASTMADCAHCGRKTSKDNLRPVVVRAEKVDGRMTFESEGWCQNCRKKSAFVCNGYNVAMSKEQFPQTQDRRTGERMSVHFVENNGGFVCAISERAFFKQTPVDLADGRKAAKEYFEAYGFKCAGNGKNYMKDDPVSSRHMYVTIDGKRYSREYFDTNKELQAIKAKADAESAKKKKSVFGEVGVSSSYGTTEVKVNLDKLIKDIGQMAERRRDDNPF